MGLLYESRIKEIGEILGDKLERLSSILPDNLVAQFEEEAYIGGGSLYSCYHYVKPKDYDVFVQTENLKTKLLDFFTGLSTVKTKYYKNSLVYYGEYLGFNIFITSNAISIGDYQIILKDFGTPEEVIGKFDFKHNMHYMKDRKVHAFENEYNLDTTALLFNEKRARDIVSTIMRTPKFIRRGFTLSDEELRKMMLQLSESGFNTEELTLLNDLETTSTHFGS